MQPAQNMDLDGLVENPNASLGYSSQCVGCQNGMIVAPSELDTTYSCVFSQNHSKNLVQLALGAAGRIWWFPQMGLPFNHHIHILNIKYQPYINNIYIYISTIYQPLVLSIKNIKLCGYPPWLWKPPVEAPISTISAITFRPPRLPRQVVDAVDVLIQDGLLPRICCQKQTKKHERSRSLARLGDPSWSMGQKKHL